MQITLLAKNKKLTSLIIFLIISSFFLYKNPDFLQTYISKFSPNISDYQKKLATIINTETEAKTTTNNNNDLIIDVFSKLAKQENKIDLLEKKLIKLEEQVQYKINPENIDRSALILIELYKIKNIAYQNQEFKSKINNIISLSNELPNLQEKLLTIAEITKLPSKEKIINILKDEITSLRNPTETNDFNKILNNFISIKKIKNLPKNSLNYKLLKLEEYINNAEFSLANNIIISDHEIKDNLKNTQKNLAKILEFEEKFNEATNIIFNISK